MEQTIFLSTGLAFEIAIRIQKIYLLDVKDGFRSLAFTLDIYPLQPKLFCELLKINQLSFKVTFHIFKL